MQKLRHIGSIKDLRPQNTVSTNINHKGLQGTGNEYAKERRIYEDLVAIFDTGSALRGRFLVNGTYLYKW